MGKLLTTTQKHVKKKKNFKTTNYIVFFSAIFLGFLNFQSNAKSKILGFNLYNIFSPKFLFHLSSFSDKILFKNRSLEFGGSARGSIVGPI
jgi:hypothetical protein